MTAGTPVKQSRIAMYAALLVLRAQYRPQPEHLMAPEEFHIRNDCLCHGYLLSIKTLRTADLVPQDHAPYDACMASDQALPATSTASAAAGHLLRVRFAETDQMGVAHHSSYIVWLEVARVEWLRMLGLSYCELEASGVSLAVSEVHVLYRAAAYFDDELQLSTGMTELRSRRCGFEYEIRRPADGALIAAARTLHVPTGTSGAMRLPEQWLQQLAPHVSGSTGS